MQNALAYLRHLLRGPGARRQRAMAYLRDGVVYVRPENLTVHRLGMGTTPVEAVEATAPERLGAAMERALAASREGVPHPVVWDDLTAPLREAAKVRSWSAFVKTAKFVQIERSATEVVFFPYKNVGPRKRHEPLIGKELRRPSTSTQIGEELLAVFDLCE
ncbi:hypothetical protein [Lysobacter sp. CA199]|uniref:hypothetical protein n=1 Tax=Lysobacter sp. CA199 TaxID=3455608 RepID=UPI003F8D210C